MTPAQLDDLVKQIEASTTPMVVEMLRPIFKGTLDSLLPFFPYALVAFLVLLFIASVKFMFGRWGMMGSLIYNIFYFGILASILFFGGIEVLFNPFFDVMYALLYPISRKLTGAILRGTGAIR